MEWHCACPTAAACKRGGGLRDLVLMFAGVPMVGHPTIIHLSPVLCMGHKCWWWSNLCRCQQKVSTRYPYKWIKSAACKPDLNVHHCRIDLVTYMHFLDICHQVAVLQAVDLTDFLKRILQVYSGFNCIS